MDAESVRQAKLLNARKKLKKFQNKRLDHSDNNSETSSIKTTQDDQQGNTESIHKEPTSPIERQRQESITINMDTPSNTTPAITSSLLNSSSPTVTPLFTTPIKSPPPSSSSITSPPPSVRSPPSSIRSLPPSAGSPPVARSPPLTTIVSPLLLSQQPLNMVASASSITSPRYMELQNKSQSLEHEKSILSQQVHKLEHDYFSLKSQFDSLNSENNEQLIGYQQKLQEAFDHHRILEKERDQVQQALLDSNKLAQENKNQADNLRISLNTANEKIALLNKKIEDLEAQQQKQQHHDTASIQNDDAIQQLKKENESFKKQLDDLQANNNDFITEQTRLIDMVNDLEEELAKTLADNYTKGREIEALTEKLNGIDGNTNVHTIERSASQSSSVSSSIFNQSEEMAKIKNEIHQLAQEREYHLKLINDLEKKNSEKQNELLATHHELEEIKSQLENKQKENDVYKQRYNDKNTEANDLLEKLQSKDKDITTHIERLVTIEREHQEKLNRHSEEWEIKLKDSVTEIDQKYDQLEKNYLEQQNQYNELKIEFENSNNIIQLKDEEINVLKTNKGQVGNDNEELKMQVKNLIQEIENKQQQIVQVKETINQVSVTVKQVTKTLNQFKQERDSFEHHLNEANKQIEDLETILEKKDEAIKKAIDKNLFIQQTLKEKIELYDNLLKSKKDLEQQLQLNQEKKKEQDQALLSRLLSIEGRADQVTSKLDNINEKVFATIEIVEQRINGLTKQLEDAKHLIEVKQKEHQDTLQELTSVKQTLSLLRNQAHDQSTEVESKTLEQQLYISKLESEKLSQQEQYRYLEEQLTLKDDEINEKQELVELLEEARASLLEEKNRLKAQCEQLEYNLNHHHQQSHNTFAAFSNSDNFTWENKCNTLESQLSEKNLKIQSLETKLEELEMSLQEHQSNNQINNDVYSHQNEDKIKELEHQVSILQDELNQLKNSAEEQVRLYDAKVAELALSDKKYGDLERMLEQARYQWMTEQTKVATLTEEISQLQRQIQTYSMEQQKLRRQLDETRQLLASNDQNKEALQWQVTDMESSVQLEIDMLNRELKDTQQQLLEKSLEVEQLQQKLTLATTTSLSSLSISGATDEYEHISSTSPKTSSISSGIQTEQMNDIFLQQQQEKKEEDDDDDKHGNDKHEEEEEKEEKEKEVANSTNDKLSELEKENKELKLRLERQFDAFTTIRGELTTVRERQLNAELNFDKERNQLKNQTKELEQIIERLKNEYQEHLERMWQQHEAIRHHHEEDLTLGRNALDAAQVKLMQNGLSPVSENGFEWANSDDDDDDEDDGDHGNKNNEHDEGDDDDDDNGEGQISRNHGKNKNNKSASSIKSPSLGMLPPLKKPAFIEFIETPRCNGCQSEVIEV